MVGLSFYLAFSQTVEELFKKAEEWNICICFEPAVTKTTTNQDDSSFRYGLSEQE